MSRARHRVRRYVGEKLWNAEQAAKRVARTATAHVEEIEGALVDLEQRRLELVESRMLTARTDRAIALAGEALRALGDAARGKTLRLAIDDAWRRAA